MMAFLHLVLTLALLVPVLVFAVEVLLSLPAARRHPQAVIARPQVAVLVPAHDEAFGIGPTLRSIQAQLRDGDRLLVVADNCSDDTASVARAAGAEVIERHDPQRRGKGYALDAGVRHLALDPSDVVVVVDADCLLHPYALACLARSCVAHARPAQALYLMHAKPDAAPLTRVAEFAWLVKNSLRPLGAARLGLPCQLMGTGMAFPWDLIGRAHLASGHIVEDLKLGLDCAAAGAAPLFCPDAIVTSEFPENAQGAHDQRRRWEHGHLGVVLHDAPRLLWQAIRERNWDLLALALDLCVPPLTLLCGLTLAGALLSCTAILASGQALPWLSGVLPAVLLGVAVGLAWLRGGRSALPPSFLLWVLAYAARKIPLYLGFLWRRQAVWIASRRDRH